MQEKTVIACLVVRLKSTRLPQKALADVMGKSMIVRIIDRLKQAKNIDKIVLTTSVNPQDAPLLDVAKENGIYSLAGSEDDVLSRLLQAAKEYDADVVLRVTGDNIFTDSDAIDRMVERHIANDADYTRTNGLPWGCTAEVLSVRMMEKLYDMIDPDKTEYLTLYACDPESFRCEFLKAPEEVNRPNYSLTVDTSEDLALVTKIYKELATEDKQPELADIVKMLDADPDYVGIPDDSPLKLPDKVITFREFLDWIYSQAEVANRKNCS